MLTDITVAIDSDLFADFMNEFVVQDETTDLQTGRPSNFLALPPNPQAATILPLTDPLHVPVHPPTPSNWSPHSSGTAAAKNQGSEFDSAGLVAPPLEALSLPDKSAMIEDRMAYVLEGAKAVGFQTFDESIVAYYTTCFDEVPSLYDQQRLSRGRRLPQFLAACCGAARGWSDWERRGFQGEILQGAEDTLVRELKTFKSSASFSEWLGMAHDRSASMCEGGEDKECEIKRKVQDEVSQAAICYRLYLLISRSCPIFGLSSWHLSRRTRRFNRRIILVLSSGLLLLCVVLLANTTVNLVLMSSFIIQHRVGILRLAEHAWKSKTLKAQPDFF